MGTVGLTVELEVLVVPAEAVVLVVEVVVA